MRNADALGHGAGVMDVAAGAAGALAVGCSAVIVELQRDADDVVAGIGQKRGGDRGIDAARHGDDDARRRRPSVDIEYVQRHAGVPDQRPMISRLDRPLLYGSPRHSATVGAPPRRNRTAIIADPAKRLPSHSSQADTEDTEF